MEHCCRSVKIVLSWNNPLRKVTFLEELQQTHTETLLLFISELAQSNQRFKQTSRCVWSSTTHEHTTASWRPQEQTQSHMDVSYLHIIDRPVPQLNVHCSAHAGAVAKPRPKMQLYFPGCLTRTGTKPCFFFVVCWMRRVIFGVSRSKQQLETEWGTVSRRPPEDRIGFVEHQVFSCQCVSLMS